MKQFGGGDLSGMLGGLGGAGGAGKKKVVKVKKWNFLTRWFLLNFI